MIVEAKYILRDEVTARLEALEKKFKHFDATLTKTDHKVKGFGKGANFANIIPSGGKLEKGLGMLNDIPNLNTGILSSAMGIANPYVIAGAAVVAFGAYAADGTQKANEWNKGMSKANVTIGETPEGLKRISDQLQKMPLYGTKMAVIPETFNQIVSGTGDVTKSMDILQYALKGSRAGFTDLATVADAGTNIMNSVGDKVSGAKEVYDVLFATLNKGKGEFKDIADYLPRIIPYSNQLGVSFKETSAMFALMTAKGQTTEQTTMLLQNAFISLLDGKKRGKMEQFVKIFDHGKIRPFANIIGDLSNKMKGMSDQQRVNLLDKLGLDAQAASAFSVLSQNSDQLKDFIGYINNSSNGKGALEKAFGDSKNAGDGVDRIKEKWEKLQMKLGQKIAPVWEKITTGLANTWDWLEKVEQKTGMFSMAWNYLSNLVKIAFAPFVSIFKALQWGYDLFQKFSSFLSDRFPVAFEIAMLPIRTTIGMFKDLFYIISETVDVLAKLANFDFEGVKDNIVAMRNHDYAINGKQQYKASQADADAMYKYLTSKGVPKDKLEAWADKLGIQVPGQGVAPKGKGVMPPSSSPYQHDNTKKDKQKAQKDLNSVSGGGTQIRNVIVNIGKQIEKVEISTTNMQGMDVNKIKKILEELLVTSVRDAEIALAH